MYQRMLMMFECDKSFRCQGNQTNKKVTAGFKACKQKMRQAQKKCIRDVGSVRLQKHQSAEITHKADDPIRD
jgi:hypothetical protein